MQRIDHTMRDKENILETIKKDLFFLLFFIPFYQSFDEERKSKTNIEVPVEGKRESFDVTLSLLEEISPYDRVIINAEGKKEQAKFDFLYKLDLTDNSITTILGNITLIDKIIKFECYEMSF